MKKIALITSAELPELTKDDQYLFQELKKSNLEVIAAVWDNPETAWTAFDLIVIRSPWDYVQKIGKFIKWLDFLENNNITIWNNIDIIRTNIDKIYLKRLQDQGITVIPSVWLEKGQIENLQDILEKNNWTKVVVKPAISATAYNTFLLGPVISAIEQKNLEQMLQESGVIIQKFMPEISSGGEWSFIFFLGKYSHAVLKRPRENDFRVQEKFGGYTEQKIPPEYLLKAAQDIVDKAAANCLYARVDGIESAGEFFLMELELIEPALFLENESKAAERFAYAIMELL